MAFEIWINRVYAHSGSIIGVLCANDDQVCDSLELPWKDNQSNVSCAPVGAYAGKIRTDGTKGWRIELESSSEPHLRRASRWQFSRGIQGCVLLGLEWTENSVKSSGLARLQLEQAYGDAGSPSDITVKFTGYP